MCLVTKAFDLVEFVQRSHRWVSAYSLESPWIQGIQRPFSPARLTISKMRRYRQLGPARYECRNDCNFRRRLPKDQCAHERRCGNTGANECDTRDCLVGFCGAYGILDH